ncbi:MAG: hypothetical protein LBS48_04515 [Treponema sp.]|nr:hypothetical protein [Treponema sp.]
MILALALFWYGLAPLGGAFVVRRSWRRFRRRFNELSLKPLLNYAVASRSGDGEEYRFAGNFESIAENRILWVRSRDLTIPVELSGAYTYVLPDTWDQGPASFDPGEEVPERIRWEHISALTGETRVFVGGCLALRDNRKIFVSSPKPLLVIFYEGRDRSLAIRTIRAGRHKNEFWNFITPYAFVCGAFSQILLAASFFTRPAFRLTVIAAFIALFAPLFPLIPPGIFLTIPSRRLWWRARICRAYRDLARLPLDYFCSGENQGRLPNGETYIAREYSKLPGMFYQQNFPFIIPAEEKRPWDKWYVFGVLPVTVSGKEDIPLEPADAFAVYGALPGESETLARRYTRKAWVMETASALLLLAGIGINMFFISMLLLLLTHK